MYGIGEPSEYPATGIWTGVNQELDNRKRVGVLGLPRVRLHNVPNVTVTVTGRVVGGAYLPHPSDAQTQLSEIT